MPTIELTDEQYRTVIAALSQTDHAWHHGDQYCLGAAAENAAIALKYFGQKTAAEEEAEEEEDEDD
jgi:hypothetical protein